MSRISVRRSEIARARALFFPIVALLITGGCVSPEQAPDSAQRTNGSGDLAGECEAEIEGMQAIAVVRPLSWAFRVGARIGSEAAHPIGFVAGAAWDPEEGELLVFDGLDGQVSAYGGDGRLLRSFGGSGEGPGEFTEVSSGRGSQTRYNQLALAGREYVIAMDLDHVHIFRRDGTFVTRFAVNHAQAGPLANLHVASLTDTTVLFARTGAMDLSTSIRSRRTSLRLVALHLKEAGWDTVTFGLLRNSLVRLPDFERFPPRDAYRGEFERTWDAISSGLLTTVSLFFHGVCFFDAQGKLIAQYRINAPVVRVDEDERERVLAARKEALGESPPFVGGTWEDFYDFWPETAPPYTDLALGPDSTVWAERRVPGGERKVDLFHATRGYLGTLAAFDSKAPLTFSNNCSYTVKEELPEVIEGENFFYGLVALCRTETALEGAIEGGERDTSALRALLRLLLVHQELFRTSQGVYAGALKPLGLEPPGDITLRLRADGPNSYWAVGSSQRENQACGVVRGDPRGSPAFLSDADAITCMALLTEDVR